MDQVPNIERKCRYKSDDNGEVSLDGSTRNERSHPGAEGTEETEETDETDETEETGSGTKP